MIRTTITHPQPPAISLPHRTPAATLQLFAIFLGDSFILLSLLSLIKPLALHGRVLGLVPLDGWHSAILATLGVAAIAAGLWHPLAARRFFRTSSLLCATLAILSAGALLGGATELLGLPLHPATVALYGLIAGVGLLVGFTREVDTGGVTVEYRDPTVPLPGQARPVSWSLSSAPRGSTFLS